MYEFKFIHNPDGSIHHIETHLFSNDLLSSSKLNKGCSFSQQEREEFELIGLLPHRIETLEEQITRVYKQFQEKRTPLEKNIYLNVLHDYNEILFYKLVMHHLEEMLPIIYTPTVGDAVKCFSTEHRKAKGLYICYQDRNRIDEILRNRLPPEVDITVVTDGEAVLGIGDQGIGGINISVAKLMVYCLCAGINPYRILPIQLDVGTNNPALLNDPMYLGWRHERINEQEYCDFVALFVQALKRQFPSILLHWEDIGRAHAKPLLDQYRQQICSFNGDIQGTGVVALACVLAGAAASNLPLPEHRIVILGAGTAGMGIAEQIHRALLRLGLSEEAAYERFWLVDREGLLLDTMPSLSPIQKKYAKSKNSVLHLLNHQENQNIPLLDVIAYAKPTILIGCSTVTGAFNEEVVKLMASHVERPIIMPLSNPNILSEADPKDLIHWTQGKAIIATGSPYPDCEYEGRSIRIAQSNNALAFPGIGLGAIAAKTTYISDDMLWAATQALAQCSPITQDKLAPLLPKISDSRLISLEIAHAVAEQARKEGLARIDKNIDLKQHIHSMMWEAKYYPYKRI